MTNVEQGVSRRNNALVIAVTIFVLSTAAEAATECDGTVSQVIHDTPGGITIVPSFKGGYIQVCNTITVWKGVPVDVCKSWLAMLLTAQVSKSSIRIYYTDTFTCNTMATFGDAPSPWFISLRDP